MPLLRYLDVVLVVLAAPILLLIGVSAGGYAIGGGTWIALRAIGVGVDRYAAAGGNASREIGVRLGYLLARLFLLALAVILARKEGSRGDGLAALFVIVAAYTVGLVISFLTRPRGGAGQRRPRGGTGQRRPRGGTGQPGAGHTRGASG